MRKSSVVFLAGFTLVSFAGAGHAQVSGDPLAGASGNSVSSHSSALGSMSKNDIKLNAQPSALPGLANSLSAANALSSTSALSSLGGGKAENVASAKLGTSAGNAPTDAADFRNALSSNNMANALGSGTSGQGTPGGANAVGMIGAGSTANLANSLGSQRSVSDQKIGK